MENNNLYLNLSLMTTLRLIKICFTIANPKGNLMRNHSSYPKIDLSLEMLLKIRGVMV
jgi:hypothetical protein